MITRKVKIGKIGVSKAILGRMEPDYIIQIDREDNQIRCVLTKEQLLRHIKRCFALLTEDIDV
jgi:hypothetical protein